MRFALIVFFFGITIFACGQGIKPNAITLSYYGEMITHPGLSVSAEYNLKKWNKIKKPKNNFSKTISKEIIISPSLGFYYHKNYQTGLFVIPEIKYKRQNHKGVFYEFGIGLGYLRTFIPNTYEVNESGEVNKVSSGHNYFASEYFVTFGKDLSIKKNLPLAYFIKPLFMYALPNFPNATGYFAIEIGFYYSLK